MMAPGQDRANLYLAPEMTPWKMGTLSRGMTNKDYKKIEQRGGKSEQTANENLIHLRHVAFHL